MSDPQSSSQLKRLNGDSWQCLPFFGHPSIITNSVVNTHIIYLNYKILILNYLFIWIVKLHLPKIKKRWKSKIPGNFRRIWTRDSREFPFGDSRWPCLLSFIWDYLCKSRLGHKINTFIPLAYDPGCSTFELRSRRCRELESNTSEKDNNYFHMVPISPHILQGFTTLLIPTIFLPFPPYSATYIRIPIAILAQLRKRIGMLVLKFCWTTF